MTVVSKTNVESATFFQSCTNKVLKASAQKRPALPGGFCAKFTLAFMFCETKGEKERRPNKKATTSRRSGLTKWDFSCEDSVGTCEDIIRIILWI